MVSSITTDTYMFTSQCMWEQCNYVVHWSIPLTNLAMFLRSSGYLTSRLRGTSVNRKKNTDYHINCI